MGGHIYIYIYIQLLLHPFYLEPHMVIVLLRQLSY